ncbi:MAG TPA: response regulator, partial [Candidatus Latescibacteria bacterium]|nr:response regulator [Candidatus Latescibacterota bacterium]
MEDHMPTEVPERRRILVIDDEEGIRDMLSEVLSREGFDVLAAGDGKQGVEMARNSAFDLVILDLKLPGQDGGKVLPLLKSIDPNLRVIIITAYLSLMSPIEARERGAYDYIPKPIDVEDLKRRVKRACGARRCDSIAYQRYDRLVETIDPAVIPIIPENMAKTFNLIA